MATTPAQRLRRDIGTTKDDTVTLPDADADDLYEEAGEKYTHQGSINAYTRVLAIQGIFASSAKQVSYMLNAKREDLSDVNKHLKDLLALWQDNLAKEIAADQQEQGTQNTNTKDSTTIPTMATW